MSSIYTSRRKILKSMGIGAAALSVPKVFSFTQKKDSPPFVLNHLFSTGMYGDINVDISMDRVLTEGQKLGMTLTDFWGAEGYTWVDEIKRMGKDAFFQKLSQYNFNPYLFSLYGTRIADAMQQIRFVKDFGGKMMITGEYGEYGMNLNNYLDAWQPAAELAAQLDVIIAIENEDGGLLNGADNIKRFGDANTYSHLGIALAPNHIVENQYHPENTAKLVRDLGLNLKHFFAWIRECDPWPCPDWASNALQIPGVGPEDFGPPIQALADINFTGPSQIFGHGLGTLNARFADTPDDTTAYLQTSKDYLDGLANIVNTDIRISIEAGKSPYNISLKHSKLQIEINKKGKYNLTIFDPSGKTIHAATITGNELYTYEYFFQSGIHLIQIEQDNQVVQRKVSIY